MARWIGFAFVVGCVACGSPQGAFKPVTVAAPDDAYSRILRGVVAAGHSIDTKDEAAGMVTTKWEVVSSSVPLTIGLQRFRWTIALADRSLTVKSQCQYEAADQWLTCDSQPAERSKHAQWLANRILSQPRGEPTAKPAVAQRGFFCATAACARDKAVCEQMRVSSGDATQCALVELAFCFEMQGAPMCARTAAQCGQQRETAASTSACAQRQ
ncbi:MAG: hypothetical protein WKG01_25885 [Kofleriaceae bacterium]